MAKLYWRVKRDGKWTWVAATDVKMHQSALHGDPGRYSCRPPNYVYITQEEEE